MKVIKVDNFDREFYDDILIQDGLYEREAQALADMLNSKLSQYSEDYYMAVSDDYVLFKREWN